MNVFILLLHNSRFFLLFRWVGMTDCDGNCKKNFRYKRRKWSIKQQFFIRLQSFNMRNIMGANFSLLRFIVLVLVVSCVSGHYFNEEKIDSHELGSKISWNYSNCHDRHWLNFYLVGSEMAQTDPLIFIAEDTIAKRNNMNQFKSM